jgi:GTP-binding protein HflX
MKVHGNLTGLKPNQRDRLEKLYDRKVPKERIVSVPLAQSIAELSAETGRQIGLTLDRAGRVVHVIVGESEKLFLPDLGRARAGRSRFRGVRLVHTHLRGEPLTRDDLTDLSRLQLDLIAAVLVGTDGRPDFLEHTHLLPIGHDPPWAKPTRVRLHDDTLDFDAFINALEDEFARSAVGALETQGQTRALAVHVTTTSKAEAEESLRELGELAHTAGVLLVDRVVQRRPQLDPKFVLGRGKLDELLLRSMQLDCELIVFDQNLSPSQVRAIADATDAKVLDRSQLILDIFARRAHTREGKLQVELAQLRYALPRLAHKTTALSRLMGGVGGRGPGETKLEIDRRRARERIHRLEREIEDLETHRATLRRRRSAREVPVVSIVGYTNAGKSTLFNAITQSAVLAEDKLFATLDTTTRRLRFPADRELVITDTVGFIRDLPKDLVAAFKGTLEELHEADLLLHVVDCADSRFEQQVVAVERVLAELELLSKPRLLVFNKVDRLDPLVAENLCRIHGALGVSALTRDTLRPLLAEVEARVWRSPVAAERAPDWMPEVVPDVSPET